MIKVSCLNPIAKVGTDLLGDNYELVENFSDSDVALVRSASVHDLDLHDNLVAVARAGAGVNNIPLDKCAENGVVVFNTPGANTNGVKELVITGMLLASRDILGGNKWVADNKDDENISKSMEKAKKQFAGGEILGKKIGIIGLGAIGRLVANSCAALGMDVVGTDPFLSDAARAELDEKVVVVDTREEIYKTCDFISVHTPLLDDTKEMINKDAMAMMKDGVVILNMARDLLVCDADMDEALKSGKVKKYVTDFPNHATANMDNVIATPHLGASTAESEDNCAIMAVKEIKDFIENGNIKNSVNYPNVSLGDANAAGRITVCFKGECPGFKNIVNGTDATCANRGDYGYAIIDLDHAATADDIAKVEACDNVLKARIVK